MKSDDAKRFLIFSELEKLDESDEDARTVLTENAEKRKKKFKELEQLVELKNLEVKPLGKNLKGPKAIEIFLKNRDGPARTDEITRGVQMLGCNINEATVRSTLVRFHNKKVKFERKGKNIYDLIDR